MTTHKRKTIQSVSVTYAERQRKVVLQKLQDDDTYCVDLSRGLLLVYEAHRGESVAHVDSRCF